MDHVDILKQGLSIWNEWRRKNPEVVPCLRGADLSFIDTHHELWGGLSKSILRIRKKNLSNYDHDEIDLGLETLNLACCDFTGASFSNATLTSADFTGSIADEAVFTNCNMVGVVLTGGSFRRSDFSGANLLGSTLGYFDFDDIVPKLPSKETNYTGPFKGHGSMIGAFDYVSDFSEAVFSGCKLVRVRFDRACLTEARFDYADLRGATGFRTDENVMRGAIYEIGRGYFGNGSDRWTTLKRVYTFPKYVLSLTFLIVFLLPHIANIFFWVFIAAASEKTRLFQPELAIYADVKNVTVFQLLFGYGSGALGSLALSGLILYNTARFILTQLVSNLREEEAMTGVSPKYEPTYYLEFSEDYSDVLESIKDLLFSYHWMYFAHRILSALFWVSITMALYNFYNVLALEVPVRF